MRISIICSSLALLALSACTSTSGSGLETTADGLKIPRPSLETTASIRRLPAPVPLSVDEEQQMPVLGQQPEVAENYAPAEIAQVRPRVIKRTQNAKVDQVAMIISKPKVHQPDVEDIILQNLPEPEAQAIAEPAVASYARTTVHGPKFRDAKPISFGRASPKPFPVHGVDISRWQGNINWQKLNSQGANFVYIKATDGGDHIDPMFRTNWKKANEAGLRRGAYHFFYWCRGGAEQADWFIRNVPKANNALPPVIDVEWNHTSSCKSRPSKATVLKKMKAFMDKLEAHYGQRPIIYSAPDFYEDNLQNAFADYPFWLRSVAAHPTKTYPGRNWVFWQYSGTGLSKGVSGHIDLNVFNGSEKAWLGWLDRKTGT